MYSVELTRYDDVTNNPDARVEWTEVRDGVTALEALESIRASCARHFVEYTRATVTDQDTGNTVDRAELVRIALAHARIDPAQRERFATWVANQVRERLFPWDDLAVLMPPPDSYWRDAACWTHRTVGKYLDDWLIDTVNARYPLFRHWLEKHDADLAAGTASCWFHRTHRLIRPPAVALR
ncbi:hypothetical protein LZ318_30785 [Saccharopolyspora indica]|uniref:hypothetical protein n=1 Tax=Saccharopolyspora indica TaxID=1229659 RepID=UPI0022EB9C01|nr:hypothetical protein [Saccharopolyspora indica]MDA3644381.1 hypothetical protein [Saccharopolyspora indica]